VEKKNFSQNIGTQIVIQITSRQQFFCMLLFVLSKMLNKANLKKII